MDNLDGLKKVVVGIVGFFIIYVIVSIRNSGVMTKKGRKKNKFIKEIDKLEKNISELKILRHKEILTEDEYKSKTLSLREKLREKKIDYYLSVDNKYILIMNSYKKGLITNEEKESKIKVVRNKIEKNLKGKN